MVRDWRTCNKFCSASAFSLETRPRRRSRHQQPYSDQPRFRWTLNRCTATAYAGFPGAQVQRSCAFAPGNPGLDPSSKVAYYDAGARGEKRDGKADGNGPESRGQQSVGVSARDPERPGIAKPEKVAKSRNSWSRQHLRRVGLVVVPRIGFPCVSLL